MTDSSVAVAPRPPPHQLLGSPRDIRRHRNDKPTLHLRAGEAMAISLLQLPPDGQLQQQREDEAVAAQERLGGPEPGGTHDAQVLHDGGDDAGRPGLPDGPDGHVRHGRGEQQPGAHSDGVP